MYIKNFKQKGYMKITILHMITALENETVYQKLRLIQKQEFNKIKARYSKLGYLTKQYLEYLNNLFMDFIIYNFEFKDKQIIINPVIKQQHIGLTKLKQLQNG